jgi:hypothetical protein
LAAKIEKRVGGREAGRRRFSVAQYLTDSWGEDGRYNNVFVKTCLG